MSNIRKVALVTGETYHIFTRSIAGFEVFRPPSSYERFICGMSYYNQLLPRLRFSDYLKLLPEVKQKTDDAVGKDPIVQIIAYCVMPTHIHLILKQLYDDSISSFMSNLLNSFTRYFNLTLDRRGPLWESKFKNVLVETDEQLLHLTRYIHLNPVSAGLVELPTEWKYSSYTEYLGGKPEKAICNWKGILDIQPSTYQKFVGGRISYQRSLSRIKRLLIENYTG